MVGKVDAREAGGSTQPARVGIVGAGTMGAGIAQVALEAGDFVRLHDVDPDAIGRARDRIGDGLVRRGAKRGLDSDRATAEAAAVLERLVPAASIADVAAHADVVIEAALEDLSLKQTIIRALSEAVPAGAIVATNTSALGVGAVAALARRRESVVGLHFFNPAPLMRLVEVVAPAEADPAIVARAAGLVTRWGKTPVECSDSPGFIVNRVNRPFTLEALRMLEAGDATVDSIDVAVRAAGFPMGPFELMDLVGIDVNLAAARGVYEGFGRDPRFRPSPIQERLVADGELGRKSGRGFYRYDDVGRAVGPGSHSSGEAGFGASRGLEAGSGASRGLDAGRAVERIVLAIVNEAFTALGEGLAGADDIDLAMRLGAGHPVGPFERTRSLGGRAVVARRLRELAAELGQRFDPAPPLSDVR